MMRIATTNATRDEQIVQGCVRPANRPQGERIKHPTGPGALTE